MKSSAAEASNGRAALLSGAITVAVLAVARLLGETTAPRATRDARTTMRDCVKYMPQETKDSRDEGREAHREDFINNF